MSKMIRVAAACALVFSVSAAQAAAESSASISGLNFTLIDLAPTDGIAPSFSFLSSTGSTVLTLNASDSILGENESQSQTRAGTFSFSRDALISLTNVAAHGSVSKESLSVSGIAVGPQTSYNVTASTGLNNPYYYYPQLNLSLSANSLLLIDANVSLAASATNPQACGSYYYYCNSNETASASATSYLSYSYTGSSISSNYSGSQTKALQATARGSYTDYYGSYQYDPALGYYTYVYTTYPKTEEVKQLDDTLRSVFSNSTNLTQSATFGLSVSVTGSAMTAAIPEPGTYVLMLQGLLLGGWLVRRSRQQA